MMIFLISCAFTILQKHICENELNLVIDQRYTEEDMQREVDTIKTLVGEE